MYVLLAEGILARCNSRGFGCYREIEPQVLEGSEISTGRGRIGLPNADGCVVVVHRWNMGFCWPDSYV